MKMPPVIMSVAENSYQGSGIALPQHYPIGGNGDTKSWSKCLLSLPGNRHGANNQSAVV